MQQTIVILSKKINFLFSIAKGTALDVRKDTKDSRSVFCSTGNV